MFNITNRKTLENAIRLLRNDLIKLKIRAVGTPLLGIYDDFPCGGIKDSLFDYEEYLSYYNQRISPEYHGILVLKDGYSLNFKNFETKKKEIFTLAECEDSLNKSVAIYGELVEAPHFYDIREGYYLDVKKIERNFSNTFFQFNLNLPRKKNSSKRRYP